MCEKCSPEVNAEVIRAMVTSVNETGRECTPYIIIALCDELGITIQRTGNGKPVSFIFTRGGNASLHFTADLGGHILTEDTAN